MTRQEELKLGFDEWYKFGLDDYLKKNIASLIKFYYDNNNLDGLDDKDKKDKMIEDLSELLFQNVGLDKNIIKRYLKYHLEMYNSTEMNYYADWYNNYGAILQDSPDWKYEVSLEKFYPEVYNQTLKQLNIIKNRYKMSDEKIKMLQERIDDATIKFQIETPNVFGYGSKVYYEIFNNVIVFELPIYFIKDQYDKYKKLNLEDMSRYVHQNVNVIKIIHEVNHILQQEILKKKSVGEKVFDENGNVVSLTGDYWQDLSERMADRSVAEYVKRQLGIKDWNEIIKVYQNEYYNYIVKNKLNIDFNNRDDEQQKKKIAKFLYGVMPQVKEEDIDKVDFNQLIKWVKEYSLKSFQNSNWYRYAKQHWGMAGLMDKDIPQSIIGRTVNGLYKIADALEEFGCYDIATDVDELASIIWFKDNKRIELKNLKS